MIETMVEKLKKYQKSNFTNIKILLDRSSSALYERKLVMEYELFIGCIGGIMAIFTGFSFIVLFEFCYFFTVRWIEEIQSGKEREESMMRAPPVDLQKSISDPDLQ